MVEFRIHTKQTKKTFSELQVLRLQASGLQASGLQAQKSSGVSNKYAIQFNNMFANVTNAKPGCRSCRGTY